MQGLNLAKKVAAPIATGFGGPLLGLLTNTAVGALEGGPAGAVSGAIDGGISAAGLPNGFTNQTMGNRMRTMFGLPMKMGTDMGGNNASGNLLKVMGY